MDATVELDKIPYEIAKGLIENSIPSQSDWDKVKNYMTYSIFSSNEILTDINIIPEAPGGKSISNIYRSINKRRFCTIMKIEGTNRALNIGFIKRRR